MKGSSNNSSILLLLFLVAFYSPKATASYQAEQLHESNTAGCPVEYFHNVKLKPEKSFYEIGENVTLHCRNAERLRYPMHRRQPSQLHFKYIPYPSNVRECLSNGTWSSQRPTCVLVHATTDPARDLVNASPIAVKYCEDEDRACGSEEWINVGSVHETCTSIDNESSVSNDFDSVLAIFTFSRHFYMSLVYFPSLTENKLIGIKVKAKRQDRIAKMSKDSEKLLAAHRETFRKSNPLKTCAVSHLATFTREIVIEFSFEPSGQHKNIPEVQFFVIPENGSLERGLSKKKKSCPKPPLILHSELKSTRKTSPQNKITVLYECHKGYEVIDSTSTKLSSSFFTLSCLGGHEWDPYPFPACRQIKEPDENSVSSSRSLIGIVDAFSQLLTSSSYVLKRSVNQVDYDQLIINGTDVSEDYPVDTDNTLKYVLLAAALLVGIIVGIAAVSAYFYNKSSKEKSKICANRIERRHEIYNDQTQVDPDGYLVIFRDDFTNHRYIIPSSLHQSAARNVAVPTRRHEPSARHVTTNFVDFDPLLNDPAVPTESCDTYVTPIALYPQALDNHNDGEYVNLMPSNPGNHVY